MTAVQFGRGWTMGMEESMTKLDNLTSVETIGEQRPALPPKPLCSVRIGRRDRSIGFCTCSWCVRRARPSPCVCRLLFSAPDSAPASFAPLLARPFCFFTPSDFQSNALTRVPSVRFAKNLQSLWLSSNKITSIEAGECGPVGLAVWLGLALHSAQSACTRTRFVHY